MKSKRSQSGIIAAVLLIMIVIISAVVIISFVVPFVKERLEGGDCLDLVGKIEIRNNLQYTCYNSTSNNLNLQIHYGDIQNLTKGFQVSVGFSGQSEPFTVIPTPVGDVTMYPDEDPDILIPGKNQERTYILGGITNLPESIEVYPILKNGKTCDSSDSLAFVSECVSYL